MGGNKSGEITRLILDKVMAEATLGELLAGIKPNIESSGRGTIEKHKSLPLGITKKDSHYGPCCKEG